MARDTTYDTFGIHQILPATGWSGIWWTEGRHAVLPIHLLALVTRTTRRCSPGAKEVDDWPAYTTAAEKREIVAMELTDCGFSVCEQLSNYCGLLAPDMTLGDFEAWGLCLHKPDTPAPETPPAEGEARAGATRAGEG